MKLLISILRSLCLVSEAFCWVMLFRIMIYFRSELINSLSCNSNGSSALSASEPRVKTYKEIRQAILRCRKLLGQSSCLSEALALHCMLRRRHIHSEVVLGAKLNEENKFQAHAWLEINGQAIFGLDPQNYFQRFS